MSVVIINPHSARARLKTCHNALTVVSTIIKAKREILLPPVEDLPHSVLLVSAGHASLTLSLSLPFSLGGHVRFFSVSL